MKGNAKTWKQCPECGSPDYVRSKTVDLEITHKGGLVSRHISHATGMPWWFECLHCGFREPEYEAGARD